MRSRMAWAMVWRVVSLAAEPTREKNAAISLSSIVSPSHSALTTQLIVLSPEFSRATSAWARATS